MAAPAELGSAPPDDALTDPYRATMAWTLEFVAVDGMQRSLLFEVLRCLLRDDNAQGKRPITVVAGTLCGVLGVSVDRLLFRSGIAWTLGSRSSDGRKVAARRMVRCDVKRGVVFRPRTDVPIRVWKARNSWLVTCALIGVVTREDAGFCQGFLDSRVASFARARTVSQCRMHSRRWP